MKKLGQVTLGLFICALAGAVALAGVKSERVTFFDDVTVNGKVVKKGTHKVTYDDKTGELTIFVSKDNVVKTEARLEKRDRQAKDNQISAIQKQNERVLRSITFAGEDQAMVLNNNGELKAGPTQ